ncbi:MAG: hypothetical protein A4E65_00042 [Syntrophorhabdus sp. PtaU1.Bin153]|nr:MAG: hypothetical protein A4E65_00042 [Syntrophorhabdus sp. PtaU1.Bin153]
MIKSKGVCDVCGGEFELDEGRFAIKIVEDKPDGSSKQWTITIASCVNNTRDESFSHVCGLTCLFQAIEKAIEKKTGACRFKVIGYKGTDDSTAQVIDLADKTVK